MQATKQFVYPFMDFQNYVAAGDSILSLQTLYPFVLLIFYDFDLPHEIITMVHSIQGV